MQIDMHYYGTLAMALAAGIPEKEAEIIAYAAQFVDDANSDKDADHEDGGQLVTFATCHHLTQSTSTIIRRDKKDQKKIWVPNHFVPAGCGKTLDERLICGMDSKIARTMMAEHIIIAKHKPYALALIGIALHAYEDTFSHYGFSGVGSKYNRIVQFSIKTRNGGAKISERVRKANAGEMDDKYLALNVLSFFSEAGALGHGPVMSLPDYPYLEWQFEFEIDRPDNGRHSVRNNPDGFLEALEKTHGFLVQFAAEYFDRNKPRAFKEIKATVEDILSFEGPADARSQRWLRSKLIPAEARYDFQAWDNEMKFFKQLSDSSLGRDLNLYKFHQAAAYHRHYMLKDLLPRFGMAVY